jgi:hypothetical protein
MRTAALALLVSSVLAFSFASSLLRAQDPDQKPNVFLQNNKPKTEKESNTRVIDGTVKDASDNPQADAIVQLKNLKTSSIVNFATKEDGKYVFRDLPLDIDFELLAKHGDITTPPKKVSIYDTRKHVIVNFQLTSEAARP